MVLTSCVTTQKKELPQTVNTDLFPNPPSPVDVDGNPVYFLASSGVVDKVINREMETEAVVVDDFFMVVPEWYWQYIEDYITVNFKTMNNNFRETNAKLAVKYYVKSSTPSDLNVGTDYYKEITPLSFKGADPAGNLVDLAYSLDNYKVYQATFSTADINAADSSGLIKEDSVRIYIQIGLEKDGLSSGTVSGEKATESIKRNMLAVYTTKLFDLE